MTPHVMKRDGCKVPFKSERIQEAILRAAKAAGVDDADYCATVAEVVSSQMNERSQVDINEIQTAVENQLMAGPYKQLARAYIEYRHDRDVQREKRGRLNQEIRGLVEQTNSALLNENANKDSKVIPTQRDLLAGIVAKHYARQHLLPRQAQVPPQALHLLVVVRGAFPLPAGQVCQPLAAPGVKTDSVHRCASLS